MLVLALLACGEKSPERNIQAAKELIQKRDLKSAEIKIKNVQQKTPDQPEVRYLMGSIFLAQQNVGAAEIEFRKALALNHPSEQVVPDLARAMVLLGQAQKLVDEFGSTQLATAVANASLQTSLAKAYMVLEKPVLAQTALNAALAAEPGHAPALVVSARQKAVAQDFDAALALLDAASASDTDNADAWKLKGDILLYAKNTADAALLAYQTAIQKNPKLLPAHSAAVTVLLQQKKFDDAGKQLEQLKKLAPDNPQTKYLQAQLEFHNKRFKEAKALTQELLAFAPTSPRVLQLAGAIELATNALPTAENFFLRATQSAPELALARRLLIVTYLRSGQATKALAVLNAGLGKDGLNADMYLLAGEAYLQNGEAARAQAYFAKALKLDPDDAKKRTALAISRLVAGQEEAGIDELQGIAQSDTGSTADLALVSAHLARKNYAKALVALDKLDAKQPDKAHLAQLRGRILLAQKDSPAARQSFERALKFDPTFFAATASLAALDMVDKKPDEAKKRFDALLAKNPKNAQALLALAELAVVRGANKDEVSKLLGRVIELNPLDIAPRLLLIDYLVKSKDPKRAVFAAQDAIAAIPSSPELLDALGRVQQEAGEFNQAIATFGRLIALQPQAAQPHLRLAGAQMANNNRFAAEQSMRRALEIKPDDLQLQGGLIVLLLETKKFPDAMAVARLVQKQRPDAADGYAMEGDVAAVQRDWLAAVTAYRAGLARAPSTALAIKMHTVSMASKPAAAESFSTTWMGAHPKDAAFLSYLGDVALAREDWVGAEKQFQAALKVDTNNAAILNNLAWVSHRLGKSGAVTLAEKANSLAPNQPALMDTLAMLLSQRGDHSTAIDLQKRALELQQANFSLRLNLAKIYIAAGSKERAKRELDELVKLGEKHPVHDEVVTLLAAL